MLMKKLTSLLASICILATALAATTTSVSAIASNTLSTTTPELTTKQYFADTSSPSGLVLPEFDYETCKTTWAIYRGTDKKEEWMPYEVEAWGGLKRIAAFRGDGKGEGYCLRLLSTRDGHNWAAIKYYTHPFVAGTEYVLTFDYARGPWASGDYIGMKVEIGGASLAGDLPTPDNTWRTQTWEFTAKRETGPTITFDGGNTYDDIYIDNFVVKEKATGNVVLKNNFDMFPVNVRNWGYDPGGYAETYAFQFDGWPANDAVGIIERGTGYAVYVRNPSDAEAFEWDNSELTEKANDLPDGTYTVKYDYVSADQDGWNTSPNTRVADALTWDQNWNMPDAAMGGKTWTTYTGTWVKTADDPNYHRFGFKFLPGCRTCVDNLQIIDSNGKVVLEEKFDYVPLWADSEYTVGNITVSQEDSMATASVDVTNTYNDTRSVTLITAIYDGNLLADVDITTADVVGDPTGANAVTTVSYGMSTTGYTGKTFSAFLWDSVAGMSPLANSVSVTIE